MKLGHLDGTIRGGKPFIPSQNLGTTSEIQTAPRLLPVVTIINAEIDCVPVPDRLTGHITARRVKTTRRHPRHDMVTTRAVLPLKVGAPTVGIINTITQIFADLRHSHRSTWWIYNNCTKSL